MNKTVIKIEDNKEEWIEIFQWMAEGNLKKVEIFNYKLKCINKIRYNKELSTEEETELVDRFEILNSKEEVRDLYNLYISKSIL